MMTKQVRRETIRNLFFLLAAACVFSGCSVATWSVEQAANPEVKIVVGQTAGEVERIVGFTPLGDLVVLTKSGRLMLLDAQTGERKEDIRSFSSRKSGPHYLTLASNGILGCTYLARDRSTASLSVWDTAVYPPKQTLLKDKKMRFSSFRFRVSPDGSVLAMKDGAKGVSLWDPKLGKKIVDLDVPKPATGNHYVMANNPQLVFSASGKYLAVQTRPEKEWHNIDIRIFSVPEGTLQHSWSFPLPKKSMPDVSVSHLSDDGRRVLFHVEAMRQSETLPGRWWLCDVPEGKKMLDVQVNMDTNWSPFRSRMFGSDCGGPTGQYILSRKEDGSGVCAYDLATGKRCGEWELTRHRSHFFLFGDTLVRQDANASARPQLEFWNLKTNEKIETSQDYPADRLQAISPDGCFMVFRGMQIFRRSDGKQLLGLLGRDKKCNACALQRVFSRDSKRLAFLCDGTVGIIDLESLSPKIDETNGSEE